MSRQESVRPHLAGVVEDRWNLLLGTVLVRRGWRHVVLPHAGYGGAGFVRVFARVVHAPVDTRILRQILANRHVGVKTARGTARRAEARHLTARGAEE